jgi:competence protein ComEA
MLRMFISTLAVTLYLAAAGSARSSSAVATPQAKPVKPVATINVNTASSAELESLPGIGAKVAARIVEYRRKNGPFRKVEELMNVQGVGEKSFLKLRSQLTVGSKSDAAGQH